MKQPAFVFGMSLLAACAQPKQPLCNADGSPACGNIGQVGRASTAHGVRTGVVHPVIGVSATIVPAPEQHAWVTPPSTTTRAPRTRPLLSPRVTSPQAKIIVDRPLVTREERPATGNVMGKCGGSCRKHDLEVAQPVDATATPAPNMAAIAPLVKD